MPSFNNKNNMTVIYLYCIYVVPTTPYIVWALSTLSSKYSVPTTPYIVWVLSTLLNIVAGWNLISTHHGGLTATLGIY